VQKKETVSMKVIEVELSADVTRSKDYQSVKVGARVRFQLAEGENKTEAMQKATDWLIREANRGAQKGLERVLFGPGGEL
jgi:hypothetical protein